MKKTNAVIIIVAVVIIIAGIFIYKNFNEENRQPVLNLSLPENIEESYIADYNSAADKLRANQDDYDALLTVARIKAWSEDFSGALEAYQEMMRIKPEDLLPYFNSGDVYLSLKDYEKAADMYEKVLEINPKWVNAYREIFSLYKFHLTSRYDDNIVDILNDGIEANFDEGSMVLSNFYAMLGVYYQENENKDKAIENYKKALELNPENNSIQTELDNLQK